MVNLIGMGASGLISFIVVSLFVGPVVEMPSSIEEEIIYSGSSARAHVFGSAGSSGMEYYIPEQTEDIEVEVGGGVVGGMSDITEIAPRLRIYRDRRLLFEREISRERAVRIDDIQKQRIRIPSEILREHAGEFVRIQFDVPQLEEGQRYYLIEPKVLTEFKPASESEIERLEEIPDIIFTGGGGVAPGDGGDVGADDGGAASDNGEGGDAYTANADFSPQTFVNIPYILGVIGISLLIYLGLHLILWRK